MNILNIKSTQIIKYVDYIIYGFVNIAIIVQFILAYLFLVDNKKRFQYLNHSFDLFNNLVYTKYSVTEGILASSIPNYININNDTGKDEYISNSKINLENQRKDFTEIYSYFSNPSIRLPKEYINFIASSNIKIKTINNGIQTEEIQPLSVAINRMTNSIFYVSTMSSKENFDMSNKYVYELMVNILNGHYKSFEKIIFIFLEDFLSTTKDSLLKNIFIFVISILISCLCLFFIGE